MDKLPIIKLKLIGTNGKNKEALVDGDYDGEYLSQYKWRLNNSGYPVRKPSVYEGRGNQYIYLHREVCKPPKGLWVDHINGNTLDNRSCNLRWVTPSENALNRRYKKLPTKNKYLGVRRSCATRNGKMAWFSTFVAYCRGNYLGSFTTETEAAKAWDKYQVENIKPAFRRLNFPVD